MINVSLAVRNLLRNRRRSFATFVALAIGTTSILLFGGFSANIRLSMHTAYVRTGGHLQIQDRDFFLYGSGNPTAYGIRGYRAIVEAIRSDPVLASKVTEVTPTLQFGGIAGNYEASVSRTVVGVGLVAAEYNRMRQWNEFELPQTDPPFALDGAPPDAAIIGTGVARVLQLCQALQVPDCVSRDGRPRPGPAGAGEDLPADILDLAASETPAPAARDSDGRPRIELLASRTRGTPNVVAARIVRAERQGFKELDEVYVMMQLPLAQRLVYGQDAAEVTAIMVQLHRSEDVAEVKVRLETLLRGAATGQPLAVLDFEELNPFYVQTIGMFNTIFAFIFVLMGTIVLFTVSNTMNTAVVERTAEIGTLRAIGLRGSGIRRLFVVEGGLLGVSGALAGALSALAIAALVNQLGLTWQPPGSGDRLPLVLLVSSVPGMVVGTTLGLALIAALSAWWPANRAARLAIVDALRHA
jgi:putative ABC transport system permease protein